MLALEYYQSAPKFVAARASAAIRRPLPVATTAPLRLIHMENPSPRGVRWARVRPRLAGICGSDLSLLAGHTSFYFAGLTDAPFVLGHEVVGTLLDDCEDLSAGQRVVIDPVLSCAVRGVEPCANCAAGFKNLCDHITIGDLTKAHQSGYCGDTGGGWGQQMIAHRAQLHAVPDELSDERAVLVEPLACAIRASEQACVKPHDTVLISGAGIVGLFATLTIRRLTPAGKIIVIAKYPHQREMARRFGATDVVTVEEAMRAVRRSTGAHFVNATRLLNPDEGVKIGRDLLLGGADVSLDCVGSAASLDLVMRTTRAGGRVVLSGMPGPGIDLSPAWFRELTLGGTYTSTGDAFPTALSLAATEPIGDVVSGNYKLQDWRKALDHANSVGSLGGVKVCFDQRN